MSDPWGPVVRGYRWSQVDPCGRGPLMVQGVPCCRCLLSDHRYQEYLVVRREGRGRGEWEGERGVGGGGGALA